MARNAFAAVAADVNRRPLRQRAVSSGWGGADQSRLLADWLIGSVSSDSEIRANLTILRSRARDLVKNNAWCTGFVDEVKNNVVGESGIMLQARIRMRPRVVGEVPGLATATNREIERGWKEWSHCEYASANRRYSLVDIEDLLIETVVTDGEAFVRRLRGFDNEFGYALQFVDADLVDEKFSRAAGPNINEVRMGVELDRYGAAIGYHVWNRYSSDASSIPRRREFISADDMLHIFVPMRANQVRGITWFAPIMVKARHMDGYEESELVAARAGASKMGFITNTSPDAIAAFEVPKTGAPNETEDMEPGVIKRLLPGEEYVQNDPKHPSTAFEMFTSTVLRAMARGLKVSYLTLTGDLRAANYSSMRAGLLPERDRWRKVHGFLAEHFCRPVYRDWIRMALPPAPCVSIRASRPSTTRSSGKAAGGSGWTRSTILRPPRRKSASASTAGSVWPRSAASTTRKSCSRSSTSRSLPTSTTSMSWATSASPPLRARRWRQIRCARMATTRSRIRQRLTLTTMRMTLTPTRAAVNPSSRSWAAAEVARDSSEDHPAQAAGRPSRGDHDAVGVSRGKARGDARGAGAPRRRRRV